MKHDNYRSGGLLRKLRTSHCPDPATLAAFIDEALPGEQKEHVRRHVLACDTCFEGVSQLVALKGQPLPELPGYLSQHALDAGIRRPAVPASLGTWRWVGSAVAVMVFVAVGAGLWIDSGWNRSEPGRTIEPQTMRGATDPSEEPVLLFPGVGASLPNNELRFEWREVPGAVSYEIRLVDGEGTLVWRNRVNQGLAVEPELELPPAEYFVSVQAMQPDGRLVKGNFVRFRVTP